MVVVDVGQPIVGDGDAMRVAADVVEDLLGSRERPLGIHDPVLLPEWREIGAPGVRIMEPLE